jgi:hypothetical protein
MGHAAHHHHVHPGPYVAQRRCIGGCERMFLSEGPWNRICPHCDDRNRMAATHRERPAHLFLPKHPTTCPEEK